MKILVIAPSRPGLAVQPLITWLSHQEDLTFDLITHPAASGPRGGHSVLLGKPLPRERHLSLVSYLGDWSLSVGAGLRGGYDWAICLSPHLAHAGLVLRKMKRVKKVVYWALDYYPKRYGIGGVVGTNLLGEVLEKAYRRLEKYVVRAVDMRWTVTRTMHRGWREGGYIWAGPLRIVLDPVHEVLAPLPWAQRSKRAIWAGHLSGLELAANTWSDPTASLPVTLTVTSRAKRPAWLNGLGEGIDFRGFVSSPEGFTDLVRHSLIGLAISPPGTFKQYSDSSRIKLYASLGVPTIASGVPSLEEEVSRGKIGIYIPYTSSALQEAVLQLTDEGFHTQAAQACFQFASDYTADKVFPPELKILENML